MTIPVCFKHSNGITSPFAYSVSVSSSLPTLASNNVPTPNAQTDSFHQSGTLVHRLFEGTLTSETRCLTCETVSCCLCLFACLRHIILVISGARAGICTLSFADAGPLTC